MNKIKKLFKQRPFLSTCIFFIILTGILYFIEGEETGYVTASFVMAYLVFIVWLFIYLPIKFFTNMKDKELKKLKIFLVL